MIIHTVLDRINQHPEGKLLLQNLESLSEEGKLDLADAELYFGFPLYKDDDNQLVISQMMIISKNYGVIIFYLSAANDANAMKQLLIDDEGLSHTYSQVYSRLLRQRNLRKNKRDLLFSVESAIYAPHITNSNLAIDIDSTIISSTKSIQIFIEGLNARLSDEVYTEAATTIEGGKGLLKPKPRELELYPGDSKVRVISRLETEIARFDSEQLKLCVNEINGIERIRGLAGSGKTVILAMKLAVTHLRNPDARILYTFSTKTLYQHVKRLITRFYRQFDDVDPDFEGKIDILHAWGGSNAHGVYYNACRDNDAQFYSLSMAKGLNQRNPFSAACNNLISNNKIEPSYDFVFVDEAQDFDGNFLQLCVALAKSDRVVFGADVFQNIFQTTTPSAETLLGEGKKLDSDIFLKRCYRTPCVTLICAHAVGLGVYKKQVQVIKSVEHWGNLGYFVDGKAADEFYTANENVSVYRNKETSPSLYDEDPNSLINTQEFADFAQEVNWVVNRIIEDINSQGLEPSDLLIICADDINNKVYYRAISSKLSEHGIDVNNINADKFSISDFSVDKKITFSTIHKAKGNESYGVYVVGVEALCYNPNVKNRNLLFTAMTRTKGWLTITGIGDGAKNLFSEIDTAKKNSPYLKFVYPPEEMVNQIEHDLQKAENPKSIDAVADLLSQYGEEGLTSLIKEIASKKVRKQDEPR
ncbi:Superfamily I DNA and RNA helicases [Yersinia intermedia]|uniref:DEAD/DEAH box helicase n=1 Tax=Yersinia intermedia TaxID=631 RepID=UPI0005E46F8D|nr:ATP-binding domain-containing protein [Yersinia intermedia]CQD76538.1 Superfamily I DNA and RNA helicases [Yersinia intermedia]